MATKRKTSYDKFWTRYSAAVVAVLAAEDPTPRQVARVQELHYRQLHWESHEADLEACPWCAKYPPLSR